MLKNVLQWFKHEMEVKKWLKKSSYLRSWQGSMGKQNGNNWNEFGLEMAKKRRNDEAKKWRRKRVFGLVLKRNQNGSQQSARFGLFLILFFLAMKRQHFWTFLFFLFVVAKRKNLSFSLFFFFEFQKISTQFNSSIHFKNSRQTRSNLRSNPNI